MFTLCFVWASEKKQFKINTKIDTLLARGEDVEKTNPQDTVEKMLSYRWQSMGSALTTNTCTAVVEDGGSFNLTAASI